MAPAPFGSRLSGGALLMSMPEIADLAGVKRPVVSSWRRRHPDFPAAVSGDRLRPLFHPRQVADWLVTTGRLERGRADTDLSLFTLAGIGGDLPGRELIAAVTALICLRHLDGDEPLADGVGDSSEDLIGRAARLDPDDELVLSEIRRLPADSEWLASAIDDLVEAAWDGRGAFERIMAARNHFKAADLCVSAVTPGLARLIAGVSGARERARRTATITVTDLAAGVGDLLIAVARSVGDDQLPKFTAAEADPDLARLLQRRLAVYGIPRVEMDIRIGDELPDETGDPDIVVTQIPYSPSEQRSPELVLDVLDDISVRLAQGCRAVVLGPADVLVGGLDPYSPTERRRAEFIKRGVVEAIIRLPGGLVPFRPGYETAIWTLTPANDTPWPGRILLADVSDRALSGEVVDALIDDVIMWRRDGFHPSAHTPIFGTQVRISDLVDPPRPLIVRHQRSIREFQIAAPALVARITQLEAELDRTGAYATAERRPIRSGLASSSRTSPAADTIEALAKSGRLIKRQGVRLDAVHIAEGGHHVVLGTQEVLGHSRPGQRKIDRSELATRYPRARLTEPGDVITTTVPEFGAIVDHLGYAVVEYPARVLRIPDSEQEQFTPRVLAALLAVDGTGARPTGSLRQVRRLEEYRVTLFSPAEVRLLDTLLAELEARQKLAQQEIDLLTELRDVATSGLADGTLILTSYAA